MGDGLAQKAWQALRRAGAAVGGINFRADTTPGVAVSPVASVRGVPVEAGIAVSLAPSRGVVPQTAGVAVVTSATDVVAFPAQTPGVAASLVADVTPGKPAATPGFALTRLSYSLTHRSGAATAANGTGGQWTNTANAVGLHNGTTSTSVGALAARDSPLDLTFADMVNKTELTITAVYLHFYVSQSGTVLNNGDLRLYRGDAASTTTDLLETITGNVDSLTTPRTFDITADIAGSWTAVNDCRARVRLVTDATETLVTAACDAVEIEVLAARTDTL